MGVHVDLCGQKFNMLTVLEECGKDNKNKEYLWKCICDCGKICTITTSMLKRNKSCGCYKKIAMSQTMKKYNTYDLSREYGVGYTSNNEEFYFDLEDYDKIKDYCWHMSNGYLEACNEHYNKLKLHRLVMNVTENKIQIDHINHNKNDNRKCNLRITDNQHNSYNHSLKSTNTSGTTGVSWNKLRNYWEARITVNKKLIFLGKFNNKEDAIRIRKQAEEKYFGEYSYDNSMKLLEEKYKGEIKDGI